MCVYNPVYDRQCEGSRAIYLFSLIQLTPDPAAFEQHILDAFSVLDEDMDNEQLFDFALIYAKAGSKRARRLIYEQFAAHAGDGADIGGTQLIDLDGIDGFGFVTAHLGEAARHDPEFWDTDYLIEHLKEQVPTIIDADIVALGAGNSSIQFYLDVVAQTIQQRKHRSQQHQDEQPQTYTQLKEQLSAIKRQIPYARLKH